MMFSALCLQKRIKKGKDAQNIQNWNCAYMNIMITINKMTDINLFIASISFSFFFNQPKFLSITYARNIKSQMILFLCIRFLKSVSFFFPFKCICLSNYEYNDKAIFSSVSTFNSTTTKNQ